MTKHLPCSWERSIMSGSNNKNYQKGISRDPRTTLIMIRETQPHAGLEPAASRLEVLRATIALVGLLLVIV